MVMLYHKTSKERKETHKMSTQLYASSRAQPITKAGNLFTKPTTLSSQSVNQNMHTPCAIRTLCSGQVHTGTANQLWWWFASSSSSSSLDTICVPRRYTQTRCGRNVRKTDTHNHKRFGLIDPSQPQFDERKLCVCVCACRRGYGSDTTNYTQTRKNLLERVDSNVNQPDQCAAMVGDDDVDDDDDGTTDRERQRQ